MRIHWWTVDSHHKGPSTWKMFLWRDVIMIIKLFLRFVSAGSYITLYICKYCCSNHFKDLYNCYVIRFKSIPMFAIHLRIKVVLNQREEARVVFVIMQCIPKICAGFCCALFRCGYVMTVWCYMSVKASKITSNPTVYSIACPDLERRRHNIPALPVRCEGIHLWPVASSHKGPVMRKSFTWHHVIRGSGGWRWYIAHVLHGCFTGAGPCQCFDTREVIRKVMGIIGP